MSAPSKFAVPLTGKVNLRGTPADRALLRLYFMAGGFEPRLADSSVFRWGCATSGREFDRKVAKAVRWAEKVVFELGPKKGGNR